MPTSESDFNSPALVNLLNDSLESQPDCLFISPAGSFFLEVEVSRKKPHEYFAIFEALKKCPIFVLYLIKDKHPKEWTFDNDEWSIFSKIDRNNRHYARILERYLAQVKKERLPLGKKTRRSIAAYEGSMSNNQIDEWNGDEDLRDHVAFIRLDREEFFNKDQENAAERLRAYFTKMETCDLPLALKRELKTLYTVLYNVFRPLSSKKNKTKGISKKPLSTMRASEATVVEMQQPERGTLQDPVIPQIFLPEILADTQDCCDSFANQEVSDNPF